MSSHHCVFQSTPIRLCVILVVWYITDTFFFFDRKNRRDGATVSSRVLSMTDVVGQELFNNPTPKETLSSSGKSPQKPRRKDIDATSRL